jgi:hypothetical protein
MSKTPLIANLKAESTGFQSPIAILWNDENHRYHFWISDYNSDPFDFVVYRNKLDLTAQSNTRKLESSRGYCATVLPLILPQLHDLIAADGARLATERDAAMVRANEAKAAAMIRDAAPQLLAALERIIRASNEGAIYQSDACLIAARKAIAAAKGE